MSSITTAVAVDYRLQQWAQLVKECQNHPSDASATTDGICRGERRTGNV